MAVHGGRTGDQLTKLLGSTAVLLCSPRPSRGPIPSQGAWILHITDCRLYIYIYMYIISVVDYILYYILYAII